MAWWLAAAVAVGACGGEDPEPAGGGSSPGVAAGQAEATYQEVAGALDAHQVPLCPAPGEFRPAPAGDGSAAAAHFRYVDGRIYELGPCDVPLEQRGEVRVYLYEAAAQRDEAAQSSLDRNPRPTFMWTLGDRALVEEWIFDRTQVGPAFEEVAGTAHDAISELPGAEGVS